MICWSLAVTTRFPENPADSMSGSMAILSAIFPFRTLAILKINTSAFTQVIIATMKVLTL